MFDFLTSGAVIPFFVSALVALVLIVVLTETQTFKYNHFGAIVIGIVVFAIVWWILGSVL